MFIRYYEFFVRHIDEANFSKVRVKHDDCVYVNNALSNPVYEASIIQTFINTDISHDTCV